MPAIDNQRMNPRSELMPGAYTIAQISTEEIDVTYPLIRNVEQSLEQADWREICEGIIQRRTNLASGNNIATATNPTGYVRGICMFRVKNHKRYGHLLDVPIFVAVSAGDVGGVSEAMLDHLRTLAHNQKCRMIRVWALGNDNWSRSLRKGEFDRWDHGLLMPIEVHTGAV
jgi:hypothetical protein